MGICANKNQVIVINSIKSFTQLSKCNLKKPKENLDSRKFTFGDDSEYIKRSSSSSSISDQQSEIPIDGRIENTNELIFF